MGIEEEREKRWKESKDRCSGVRKRGRNGIKGENRDLCDGE